MNIEQLNLKAISEEEMILINGGEDVLIDTSSTSYQIGYAIGTGIRYAATVVGLVALFSL